MNKFWKLVERSADKFWDLLERSVIVQSSVSLLLVGTLSYLLVTEKPIPDLLSGLLGTVLGFWFGTKVQQLAHRRTS